jgi:hypothetical protein
MIFSPSLGLCWLAYLQIFATLWLASFRSGLDLMFPIIFSMSLSWLPFPVSVSRKSRVCKVGKVGFVRAPSLGVVLQR